jgi:methyl-accepting chemotaxis protein
MKIKSLKTKTILLVAITALVITTISSVIDFAQNKRKIIAEIASEMQHSNNVISKIIDLHVNDRQKTVNTALNLAHSIFYKKGNIIEDKGIKIEINAINQITKEQDLVKVNRWTLDGEVLQNSFKIVDTIKRLSVESATIFQKIDKGYIRISTNVMKLDNTRAIGTYIPNSSEVIKTVETGETYIGRAYVVNAWYLTAYEPIYIDGKIKGILYVGVKEKDFTELNTFFNTQKFKSENLILADEDGTILFDAKTQEKNISETDYFKKIVENKSETG